MYGCFAVVCCLHAVTFTAMAEGPMWRAVAERARKVRGASACERELACSAEAVVALHPALGGAYVGALADVVVAISGSNHAFYICATPALCVHLFNFQGACLRLLSSIYLVFKRFCEVAVRPLGQSR